MIDKNKYENMSDEELFNTLKQAKIALRWAFISLVFMILALIAEFGTIATHFIEPKHELKGWIITGGCVALSFYAKWLSDGYKPESWKK